MNNKNISQLKITEKELKEKNQYIKDRFIKILNFIEYIYKKYNISANGDKKYNINRYNLQDIINFNIFYDLMKYVIKDYIQGKNKLNFTVTKKINKNGKSIAEIIKQEEEKKVIIINSENIDTIFNNIEEYNIPIYPLSQTYFESLAQIITYFLNNKFNLTDIKKELEKIDFTSIFSFSTYFSEKKNIVNKYLENIYEEIKKQKEIIEREYIKNGLIEIEKLNNGKEYIRYKSGDLEKIEKDKRIIKLRKKIQQYFDNKKEEWFENYELNNLYKYIEKDFLTILLINREKNISLLFINEIDFIKSRIEYVQLLDIINKIKFNKEYTILKKENIKELLLKLYFLDNIKIKENVISLFLEKEDYIFLKDYFIIKEKLLKELKDKNIINKYTRKRKSEWLLKLEFYKQKNLKSIYNKFIRLEKKQKQLQDLGFIEKIEQLKDKYKEYKHNFLINKDLNAPVEGDFNSITLYNNSIDFIKINTYYSYQYRCYEHSGEEIGFGGEEITRGIIIASDINDLIEKIEKEYNIKVFYGKWTKKYKEEGYKKLWIGETLIFNGIDRNKLYIHICTNCSKTFRYRNDLPNNTFCSKKCYIEYEKINTINKRKEYNHSDITYNEINFDKNIIEEKKDILKDDEIIKNNAVIYKIENKYTKKIYIGKTEQGFNIRWGQHFAEYNTSSPFREDIDKYGIEGFNFEILENIKRKDLESDSILISDKSYNNYVLLREQYYIDKYDSYHSGYNRRNNFQKNKY